MLLGDLDQAGIRWGCPEAINPLLKRGDLPGAHPRSVENEDSQESPQGGPLPVGEEPGMEIAFPYTRNLQVLQGAYEGNEAAGEVAVGLGGMVFQLDFPFFPHKGFHQLLYHGLDSLFHFFYDFFAGFVPYGGFPSFFPEFFWEGYYAAPWTHFS